MAKKETKEIVVKENTVDNFIEKAIASGASVEVMERFFALHREVKADNAKSAFIKAKAAFQGACPVIKKTKKVFNKDGKTLRYMYAPMDSVIEQIKKPLADNDLSYAWDVEHLADHMKVICKLTHTQGHAETSTFEIPIVKSEFMSSPQSYATAQTYAKRYTLLNVLGISTAEEDTDANDTGKDKDAKAVKSKIIFRLKSLNEKTGTKEVIEEAVLRLTKLELKEENYDEIVSRLQTIINENENN